MNASIRRFEKKDFRQFEKLLLPEALSLADMLFLYYDAWEEIIGVCSCYLGNGSLRICYLYVNEYFRRRGIGRELLLSAAEYGRMEGAYGMDVGYFLDEDTAGIHGLMQSLGFARDIKEAFTECITPLAELEEMIPDDALGDEHFGRLSEFSPREWKKLSEEREQGFRNGEGGVFPLEKRSTLDGEVSFLCFFEQRPVGGILVTLPEAEEITVSGLWCERRTLLPGLLKRSYEAAAEKYSMDTRIRMIGGSKSGEALIRRFVTKKTTERRSVRWLYVL